MKQEQRELREKLRIHTMKTNCIYYYQRIVKDFNGTPLGMEETCLNDKGCGDCETCKHFRPDNVNGRCTSASTEY